MATKPSFELRLRVLNAVYAAPGNAMRERIKFVAEKAFTDGLSDHLWRASLPSYFQPNCHRTISARLSGVFHIPVIACCLVNRA